MDSFKGKNPAIELAQSESSKNNRSFSSFKPSNSNNSKDSKVKSASDNHEESKEMKDSSNNSIIHNQSIEESKSQNIIEEG